MSSPPEEKPSRGLSSSCHGVFDEEAENIDDQVQEKPFPVLHDDVLTKISERFGKYFVFD